MAVVAQIGACSDETGRPLVEVFKAELMAAKPSRIADQHIYVAEKRLPLTIRWTAFGLVPKMPVFLRIINGERTAPMEVDEAAIVCIPSKLDTNGRSLVFIGAPHAQLLRWLRLLPLRWLNQVRGRLADGSDGADAAPESPSVGDFGVLLSGSILEVELGHVLDDIRRPLLRLHSNDIGSL